MWTPFRDLFGFKKATLAEFARIRDRLEHLDSIPTSDFSPDIQLRFAALSQRDVELQHGYEANCDDIRQLADNIDEMETWRKEIVIAVSEGIERTDRAERRIKATVARARGQLAKLGYDDPGLEAEAVDLHLIDGERGGDERVPPVPQKVAQPESATSSVRGVPAETMRRARGF